MNLLLVLEALLLERNVSRAGKRIGLSQPAVSNALSRLREHFADRLFVSTGREMTPTARALKIAGPMLEALNQIRAAVGDSATFDPSTQTGVLKIATSEYAELFLIPAVLRDLRSEAPSLTVKTMRLSGLFEIPTEMLRNGSLQMAVGLFPQPILPGTSICSQPLLEDIWVCVARQGHPEVKGKLSFGAFLKIQHIRVNYGEVERPGFIGDALTSLGKTRKVALSVPHLTSVPAIAAQTDLLGIVPLRLAQMYSKTFPITIHPIPLRIPTIVLSLVWHERSRHDAGHLWMRELVIRSAEGVAGNSRGVVHEGQKSTHAPPNTLPARSRSRGS